MPKWRRKKSKRITTTNVILILYRQFTSKTAKARYILCPGNFRMCTMCWKRDFGDVIQKQHIHTLAHMYMRAGERTNRYAPRWPKNIRCGYLKVMAAASNQFTIMRIYTYANTAAYTNTVHSRKIEQETKITTNIETYEIKKKTNSTKVDERAHCVYLFFNTIGCGSTANALHRYVDQYPTIYGKISTLMKGRERDREREIAK